MELTPRLSALVDRALRYRITEIVAATGFGKTALLNAIASTRGFVVAPVRPDDDSVLALMRALCEAVSQDIPDLLRALPKAFENASAGSKLDLCDWFLEAVANRPCRIAVDDIHHLNDDEIATTLLCKIIEGTRNSDARWVLTSRTWPRLPTVDWIARGEEGATIGESDLVLTVEDLENVGATIGLDLPSDVAVQMAKATRGWPLLAIYGLRLIQQGQSPDEVLGAIGGRGISAIVEQLLARLTAEERRLLIAIALFDGAFPEELDIAILNSSQNAQRLSLAGVPVMQGSDRRWRLQDACRKYLLARDASMTMSEALFIASELERRGKYDQALRIATASGGSDLVRYILEMHTQYFVDGNDPHLLRSALATLSRRTLETSPQLLLVRGIEERVRGDLTLGVDFLRRAVDLSVGGFKTYAKARLLQGLLELDGYAGEARLATLDLADAALPENDEDACDVLGILAQALSLFGEVRRAREALRRALELLPRISSPPIEARTYLRASRVALDESMFEEADLYAARAAELSEQNGLYISLSLALQLRLVALAPTDEARAIECGRHGLKCANHILSKRSAYYMQASLFSFVCRSGDVVEARALRRHLLPVPSNERTRVGGTVLVLAAGLALLEESYWEAAKLLAEVREFGELTYDAALVGAREIMFHAYSAILHQYTEDEDAAVKAAHCVLETSAKVSLEGAARSAVPEIEISRIIAATIFGINGRMLEAEDILGTLERDAHEEYRRDLARWARRVLSDPDAEPSPTVMRFAKGVVELMRRALTLTRRESLTVREFRVLELLAMGRSNKEIAAITGKSVKTIDNQVSSILRKLRARSRSEAVARARSVGALRA